MKDRFRFRAWDNREEKYIYDAQYQYDDKVECFGNMFDTYGDWYIVEQCTGLTDKNGKLIYEGDVVKIYAKNRYAYGIFQIKYDCEYCEYDMLDEEGNFIYQLQNDKTKYVEVIGNIHENPELINENNRD